jgi:hypothetical protein
LRDEGMKVILRLVRLVKGVKSDDLMKPGGYGLYWELSVVAGVYHKCFPSVGGDTKEKRSSEMDC